MNTAPQDIMLLGTANPDGTFTGVSADETTSMAIPPGQHMASAIVVIGNGTTSSGVLTYEEAYWNPQTQMPYSGTWSAITTVNASDVTGGAQKVIHVAPNALFAQRVRITTAIGGGGGISVALRYQ